MSDSPLKRTMRIDLSPSTTIAAPEAEGPPPVRKPPEPEIFVPRREERENRDTPYDKLLSSIYDAVLITDFDAHILDFNDRALEFFRADEKALPGVSAIDLISGADKSLLAAIGRNLVARKYTVIEARCTRFDGTSFPAEIAVNRIDLDAQGQLCFLVRDITVRHKAQQDLQNALERVQALDRAHLEFVSNVSHELRTPLTSMIYAVKNMQRGIAGPLPDRAVQYLARLESDCNRLLGTVNDILDLRQIENNTLTLVKSRVPLPRLVEDALASIRVQTDEKRLSVTLRRTRRAGFVLCDVHKMERVVLNIVGNSVKYTPSGGEVCLEILQEPFIGNRKYCRYRFRVSDNGIGISREFLSHVFEPFERESGRIGSTSYGSGLGMSIAKGIVDLMGGNINVESEEDAGTVVTVELEFRPFREAGGAQEETDAAEAAQNTEQISSDDLAVFQENPASAGRKNADVGWIEGRRLLLVEDNPLNREIAEEMLTEDGFKVESAENGRRALQRIVENDPWYYSAVLMDIQMPIMDGYETTERIRALPDRSRAHIPIIAMTANAFKEDRIKAAESGMDAYITKPVDVLALRYVLRRVLR